jgi:hypothetical protein
MEKELISIEVAEKEWVQFLIDNDVKSLIPDENLRMSKSKEERDEYKAVKDGFSKVAKAISQGQIIITDGVITQKLKYPIKGKDDGTIIVEKLEYGQRVSVKDREEIFKGIDREDAGDALVAQRKFCSKLTGIDMAILGKLDILDAKITDQIVSVFFM